MINTYQGLILPLVFDAFGVFLMKQFMEQIPSSSKRRRRSTGPAAFRTFTRSFCPIARPAVITLTILATVGVWNEFLHPLIAANRNELRTLPVGLSILRGAVTASHAVEHDHDGVGDRDDPDGDRLLRVPALLPPGLVRSRQGLRPRATAMSRTMATDSLSMTGGGAALVTDPGGSIESTDVAGLFVEDVRALSRWRIDPDLTTQLVGRVRLGPSSDRLVWTLSAPGAADPVATFERTRTVVAAGLREELAICPFIAPLTCTLRMHAASRRAVDLRRW